MKIQKVFIVGAKRTPVGSFGGVFKSLSAPQLGAKAIVGALEQAKLQVDQVGEVLMGCVLQANIGQAPARQAAIFAGIPASVPATTINKVCASGLKAVMLAAQSIALGNQDVVVAGGMENMSAVPYYQSNLRFGNKLGNVSLVDGLVKDGLTDVYNQDHMGCAAELCAATYQISREAQDDYALQSYDRSTIAWENGKFDNEVVPVEVDLGRGNTIRVSKDEEYTQVKREKIPLLKPVFKKDGTVTAANASTLNDGAAALVLASEAAVKKYNLTILAEIKGYSDAAQAPEWFTTSPVLAINHLLTKHQLMVKDIDLFEINEAFSVVALANQQLLHIPVEKINIYGGAISLGHPLGASGARILCTLITALKQEGKSSGIAAICNGGGGASALWVAM